MDAQNSGVGATVHQLGGEVKRDRLLSQNIRHRQGTKNPREMPAPTMKGFYNSRPMSTQVWFVEPLQGSDHTTAEPRVARRFAPAYPGLYDRTASRFARGARYVLIPEAPISAG